METRFSIYKAGYIKEDLTEIDAARIYTSSKTFNEAESLLCQHCNAHNTDKADYYIQQEQKENIGWVMVEGTETHF